MPGILDFSAKCLVRCGFALAMFGTYGSAHAWGHETLLYSFCSQASCVDGSGPEGGVFADSAGNLFGTTSAGANGGGNVFEIASDGTYSVFYSFCPQPNCADGSDPSGSLIMDGSGNLYGTTTGGGKRDAGTVFKLAPNGTETVLYSFCHKDNCRNGAIPLAGVIVDSSGNLYGTTSAGGQNGSGTVFRLGANGKEKVLHNFAYDTDGASPSSLVLDSAGNLYGTAQGGGTNGDGNVFEVSPDGTFKLLYSFCSHAECTDGSNPAAGLIMDGSGNLYGTTFNGGAYNLGTVFKLAANGTETVLYSFCSRRDCSDGAYPVAGLIMDGSGNLYGTTQYGAGRDCYENQIYQYVCGTVFKLGTNGAETVLYSFCSRASCADGLEPEGSLIMDSSGNLDGTTFMGGKGHCINGCGTVFRLDAGRKKTN